LLLLSLAQQFIMQKGSSIISYHCNGWNRKYQEKLLTATIIFQEKERKRIAADLHDDVGSLLSVAGMYIDDVSDESVHPSTRHSLIKARSLLDAAIEQARRITYDMAPYGLEVAGLESAIGELIKRTGHLKEITISVHFLHPSNRLNYQQELMAFRVTQEVVNNILKHSSATFIHITQQIRKEIYQLEIVHDGIGLTHEEFEWLLKQGNGMGLKNIRSRLQSGKGSILFGKENLLYKILVRILIEDE
jgi:two-component system NarL family sensor kinase